MCVFRAENTEKVEEYEQKIADIMSGKVDTIFMMKEEVEAEYSDRMSGGLMYLREAAKKQFFF